VLAHGFFHSLAFSASPFESPAVALPTIFIALDFLRFYRGDPAVATAAIVCSAFDNFTHIPLRMNHLKTDFFNKSFTGNAG
jgi:hypothetical protein